MVILDDEILMSVRQYLLDEGFEDDELKPAVLLKELFQSAREGSLSQRKGGSLAKCMKRDLLLGLDDPYDDRATASFEDMQTMEQDWRSGDEQKPSSMPLVVFVRTQSANSLFRSNSATNVLLNECNTDESTNLIVLGSGIDSTTLTLPRDSMHDGHQMESYGYKREGVPPGPMPRPYFGFAHQNRNASGQNDPEGSRRSAVVRPLDQ